MHGVPRLLFSIHNRFPDSELHGRTFLPGRQTAPKMEAESHLDKTVADEPARAERHDVHHHAMRILRYLSVFLFAFSLTGLAHSGKRSDPNHRVRGRC